MKKILSVIVFVSLNAFVFGQDIEEGKTLFNNLCAACHETGSSRLVGPGLKGISEKRERSWIINFVQNSQAMIAAGDPDAVAIYEEYGKAVMNPHDISPEQVDNIIAYIDNVAEMKSESAVVSGAGGSAIQIEEEFVALPKKTADVRVWVLLITGFLLTISVFVIVNVGATLANK